MSFHQHPDLTNLIDINVYTEYVNMVYLDILLPEMGPEGLGPYIKQQCFVIHLLLIQLGVLCS